MIILFTVALEKKIQLYKMSYLPKAHTQSKDKLKVELDLCHYATQCDLKNTTVLIHQILLKKLI